MRIAVLKEIAEGERCVALVPDVVKKLIAEGHEVRIETGAGEGSGFSDACYLQCGAIIASHLEELLKNAEVILKFRPPSIRPERPEVDFFPSGSVFISLFQPYFHSEIVHRLAERKVTAFSLDLVPRTSRAQRMDALSSLRTVEGYRAVLLAAESLPRFFPMLTTAAGTIPPAQVLVVGAGVAGLQAIATARRLGAVVRAFDIRPAVREEVLSLGAAFVGASLLDEKVQDRYGYAKEVNDEMRRKEEELLGEHTARSDAVILTASVPGKKAPVLLTRETVEKMRPGSVIVDLAAEMGGNCALTVPGKETVHRGIKILGPVNLPSELADHASFMYAKNLYAFLGELAPKGKITFDFSNDILRETCATHEGRIFDEEVRVSLEKGVSHGL
jgi:proton-translocating NAD(P)+ transhydrogenase subunit alpha